tara:strand:+ start:3320 stop:4381 length:1062 start_codon:yes stop_codon:yes gene_type:complete
MDTVIYKSHIVPVLKDSITVKADYSLIVAELDSIKVQNAKGLKQINNTLQSSLENENFLGLISFDTLFTILVPILIFILGILVDRWAKNISQCRKRKDIRGLAYFHLAKIGSFIEKIEVAYRRMSEETSLDSGILLTPPRILSNDFQRILNIDYQELFLAVREKNALSSIISEVETISQLLQNVDEYHNRVTKVSGEKREVLAKKIYRVYDILVEYNEEIRKREPDQFENNDTYTLINTNVIAYYTEYSGTRNIGQMIEKLVTPIQNHIVERGIFRTDEKAKEVTEVIKSLYDSINEIEVIIGEFKKQYNDFADVLNSSRTNLEGNLSSVNWEKPRFCIFNFSKHLTNLPQKI